MYTVYIIIGSTLLEYYIIMYIYDTYHTIVYIYVHIYIY